MWFFHRILISNFFIIFINSKKEDWNAIVRQNTIVRSDPIGSTRNSLNRKDRHSLRRHILEEVDQGIKMNTQKIVGTYSSHIFSTEKLCMNYETTIFFLDK